jgi:TRAP-type C4-dicarboxylate transport system permease small subunit
MAVQVVVVLAGVISRYVVNRPIAGSDEIATLVLVWLTFLGGAVAQRRRAHPSVSLLTERLNPGALPYIEAATRIVEVFFFACVCWQSLGLLQLRWGEPSAGAGFDMGLYPAALIVGVLATLLFGAGQLASVPRRPLLAVLAGTGLLVVLLVVAIGAAGFQPARIDATTLLLAGFALLLLLNAPLAVALGLPALLYLLILGGPNLLMLPQRLIAGADNFVLLAIPLFILAGALMETGGISRRLVDLAMAIVGHLRGGLAHVTVVAEILFSGISGSTTADVAAMGSLLIPPMEKAGYRREEAISIIACGIARSTMARVMSSFWPYLAVLLAGLLIVSFVPWITLVLPEKFLGMR